MAVNLFIHRALILAPANRRNALIAFWDQAIDPGHGAATWRVGLNATGNPQSTITHYWASLALTAEVFDALLAELTNAGQISMPPGWQTWTDAEKEAALGPLLAQIKQKTGIDLRWSLQNSEWFDPQQLLTEYGLQRLRPTP
jgi:hypothetical protein